MQADFTPEQTELRDDILKAAAADGLDVAAYAAMSFTQLQNDWSDYLSDCECIRIEEERLRRKWG